MTASSAVSPVNEAIESDDDRGLLQVLKLGMREFAVDLGERLFAAHGENGVAEGDDDAENSELLRQALIGKL